MSADATIVVQRKEYNRDPQRSAQPCGCDEGENYVCEWHRVARDAYGIGIGLLTPSGFGSAGIGAGLGDYRQPVWTDEGKTQTGPAPGSNGVGSAQWRKQRPLATGVLDYFPDALLEVAYVSYVGNEQHNPGQHLHWDRSKSHDEADACMRHLAERGTFDSDGTRHSAKAAWRALANLQKEIEEERNAKVGL